MSEQPSNQALQIDLKIAIDALDAALAALAEALRTEAGFPSWGWRAEDPERARAQAIQMILATEYHDDQAPNQSRYYPALIGTRPKTLELAHALNDAKHQVAEAFKAMRGQRIVIDGETRELTRHALARMGRARFHFHMATRHLVICDERPSRVGFTWTVKSSRIEHTNREALIKRLIRWMEEGPAQPNDPGILHDIEQLQGLASGTPLAFKRDPIPHPRANIAWRQPDGTIVRKLRPAVLPILYLAQAGEQLPPFRPLANAPHEQSKPRKPRPGERRVGKERLLRTLPVYPYTWPGGESHSAR